MIAEGNMGPADGEVTLAGFAVTSRLVFLNTTFPDRSASAHNA
jgi:hypothetical protein